VESALPSVQAAFCALALIALDRGDRTLGERYLSLVRAELGTADTQQHSIALFKHMVLAIAEGKTTALLELAADEIGFMIGADYPAYAAAALGTASTEAAAAGLEAELVRLAALFDAVPPASRTRRLEAEVARARGLASAAAGDDDTANAAFSTALAAARNLDEAPLVGAVLADFGRTLARFGRPDEGEPLLAEARELFERMGAVVWLERIDSVAPAATPA
jgi:hypothetical protein